MFFYIVCALFLLNTFTNGEETTKIEKLMYLTSQHLFAFAPAPGFEDEDPDRSTECDADSKGNYSDDKEEQLTSRKQQLTYVNFGLLHGEVVPWQPHLTSGGRTRKT
uniref:Secreted protein n=1 Tax=Haemonchus contortus TaxID=6289 RepID=A0A7I4YLY1_HAECO